MNLIAKHMSAAQAVFLAVAAWWLAYRAKAKAIAAAWNEYCSATDELEDYEGDDLDHINELEGRRIAAQSLLWSLKS